LVNGCDCDAAVAVGDGTMRVAGVIGSGRRFGTPGLAWLSLVSLALDDAGVELVDVLVISLLGGGGGGRGGGGRTGGADFARVSVGVLVVLVPVQLLVVVATTPTGGVLCRSFLFPVGTEADGR
jgi:hypothetical protein